MKTRRIVIPLHIVLDERSASFHDDIQTWDLQELFGAKEGELFLLPDLPTADEIRDLD